MAWRCSCRNLKFSRGLKPPFFDGVVWGRLKLRPFEALFLHSPVSSGPLLVRSITSKLN